MIFRKLIYFQVENQTATVVRTTRSQGSSQKLFPTKVSPKKLPRTSKKVRVPLSKINESESVSSITNTLKRAGISAPQPVTTHCKVVESTQNEEEQIPVATIEVDIPETHDFISSSNENEENLNVANISVPTVEIQSTTVSFLQVEILQPLLNAFSTTICYSESTLAKVLPLCLLMNTLNSNDVT